jgi:hypothetical protein
MMTTSIHKEGGSDDEAIGTMFPCGPLRACTLARIADIDGPTQR